MKLATQIKIIVSLGALGAALLILGGCGSSGSNSNSNPNPYCTATGCNYGPNGFPGSGYGYSPNEAIYASQGPINITNGASYDTFLHGSGACNTMFNSCYGASTAPQLQIVLYDDTFGGGNGISQGQVCIGVCGSSYGNSFAAASYFPGFGGGSINSAVGFRPINGNSGFATAIQSGITTNAWGSINSTGGMLQIVANGSPTTSVGGTLTVQLQFNGQVIGQGTLVRVQ